MKSNQPKPDEDMRMSEAEFERIMGQALRVKPVKPVKPDSSRKAKAERKPRAPTRERP